MKMPCHRHAALPPRSPQPRLVRCHPAAPSQVVELAVAGFEAGYAIAETFTPCQLRKSQAGELTPARELADRIVAAIAGDEALELLRMSRIEELGEHNFSGIHTYRVASCDDEVEIAHTNRPLRRPCHQRTKSVSPHTMTGHLCRQHAR